jgi:VWFA-related protein
MSTRSASLGLSLLAILALTLGPDIAAAPQTPATSGTTATPPPEITIRSSTRLVQVSVIVRDKKGNPITGLKKEDFSILDEGKPQNIAFFSSETPAPTKPPNPLPPNVFTNRFDLKGEDPGAVTIILFDALNTSPQDQSYVRKQVISFLKTVKPQDHVALYALTTQLLILHDFTQDASSLVEGASKFTPKELAAFDASTTPDVDLVTLGSDPQWQKLQNSLNNAQGIISDQNTINRKETTVAALAAIADHVAGIPGRKSLVWVSGGIPMQIGAGLAGLPGPDRETATSFNEDLKLAAQALSRVDMAVYAVDSHGVEVATGTDPGMRGKLDSPSLSSSSGFFARQDLRDSSKLLADETGGLAIFGNNGIRDALGRVFDDGRYAYTIGFYPDHHDWNGKFRKIKIHVNTEGAQVRYRKGYFAAANRSDSEQVVKTALKTAAESPLDATDLGMIVSGKIVSGKQAEPLSSRSLDLHIGLDPKQLVLENSQDHRKGAVDLFFLQRDSTGTMVASEEQHIGLNLEEKQYEYLSKVAMVLDRHLTIHPQTTEIRVVVRDAGSGLFGSVSMPTTAFFPPEATPPVPEKKPN